VGFYIAVETAGIGTLGQVSVDRLAIAPRPGEEPRVKSGDEVKYTIRHGDPLPEPPMRGQELRSIAGEIDKNALEWCIQPVKSNTSWRLSLNLDYAHNHRSER
jgi:hypothetical protein